MSKETWKEAFYPITAHEVAKKNFEEIIKHSLKKWVGLRKDNLKCHGLTEPPFFVEGDNCSLCSAYRSSQLSGDECDDCPLFKLRDVPCYQPGKTNTPAPWSAWSRCNNPEPMIILLGEALKVYQETKAKETQLSTLNKQRQIVAVNLNTARASLYRSALFYTEAVTAVDDLELKITELFKK